MIADFSLDPENLGKVPEPSPVEERARKNGILKAILELNEAAKIICISKKI